MVLVYDKQAPYENETPYGAKHPPKANLGLLPALVVRLRRRRTHGMLMGQGQAGVV